MSKKSSCILHLLNLPFNCRFKNYNNNNNINNNNNNNNNNKNNNNNNKQDKNKHNNNNKLLLFISGLKVLPPLPPESRLKNLNASRCGLESIHPSCVRIGTSLDLSYNQIKELPKEETIQFIESRGNLGNFPGTNNEGDVNEAHINLDFNPLIYPPYYIYMQKEWETCKFLKLFSPA